MFGGTRLQELATCPYPEPDKSNPHPLSYFLKFNFYIILQSTPRFSKSFLRLRFSYQNSVCTCPLHYTCHVPTHLILLDLFTRRIFYEIYRTWSPSLCSFLRSPNTAPYLDLYIYIYIYICTYVPIYMYMCVCMYIFLSTLFSDILSLCFSLNVRENVSQNLP